MTVTVDPSGLVPVPPATPGDRYELFMEADGTIKLVPLKESSAMERKVTFVKKNGYTVGVMNWEVSQQAVDEAVKEFP